jgi:hypothetical protein
MSRVPLRIGLTKLPELLSEVVRSMFEPGEAEFVGLDARHGPAEAPSSAELHAVVAGVSGPWESDVLALRAPAAPTGAGGARTARAARHPHLRRPDPCDVTDPDPGGFMTSLDHQVPGTHDGS